MTTRALFKKCLVLIFSIQYPDPSLITPNNPIRYSIFSAQAIYFLAASCLMVEDVEYRVDSSASISDWTDVSQEACADLTASTEGATHWSYNSNDGGQHQCWVKRVDPGQQIRDFAHYTEGYISGNADCGVRGIRGKGKA